MGEVLINAFTGRTFDMFLFDMRYGYMRGAWGHLIDAFIQRLNMYWAVSSIFNSNIILLYNRHALLASASSEH